MSIISRNKTFSLVFALALLGSGYWLGLRFPIHTALTGGVCDSLHEVRGGGSDFTNPLLECELAQSPFAEITGLKHALQDFVDKWHGKNPDETISVYFRDLNNGPWFGIGESEQFSPASLLKLPLMMAYLKLAERTPGVLDRKLILDDSNWASLFPDQAYPTEDPIIPGQPYMIRELLEHMIEKSDNRAMYLLISDIDQKILHDTYADLGLIEPDQADSQITVRDYASFFRMLFNASYLNHENSEKALRLLSRTNFSAGLRAGVPSSTTVAHKFGERDLTGNGVKQLHDCGIVYYPNHPYLLCMMTRGDKAEDLVAVLKGLSELVYREVDREFGK